MKNTIFVLSTMLSILTAHVPSASSQVLGTNYVWVDSATVNTIGRDSTFVRQWEAVSFWCRGGEGWFRAGAPDTASWSSRKYSRIAENQVVSFDAGTPLKRLQFRANTGNVVFYFVGYKKRKQYGN